MRLSELKPPKGSKKKKVRVGRGIGSGMGKTCARGTKGQKARRQIHPAFEGGQTPIHRRLPVKKGFKNPNQKRYSPINVGLLQKYFSAGDTVGVKELSAKGLIRSKTDGVKILGFGELKIKLKVAANACSRSAREKIEKAGGEVVNL
jgi:large subunit ribosomal protein L15